MPISVSNTSGRIFVSMALGAVARAHRAAASFSHDHPDVAVSVEIADDDRLAAADPADPPDLRFVFDGNIAVALPLGSTEHTIVDRLQREWAAVLADAEGGAR